MLGLHSVSPRRAPQCQVGCPEPLPWLPVPGVPRSDPWEGAPVWRLWRALILGGGGTVPAEAGSARQPCPGSCRHWLTRDRRADLGLPRQNAVWVRHSQDSVSRGPAARGLAPSGDPRAGSCRPVPGPRRCGRTPSPCLRLHATSLCLSRVTFGLGPPTLSRTSTDRLADHSCRHRVPLCPLLPAVLGGRALGAPRNGVGAHSPLMAPSPCPTS